MEWEHIGHVMLSNDDYAHKHRFAFRKRNSFWPIAQFPASIFQNYGMSSCRKTLNWSIIYTMHLFVMFSVQVITHQVLSSLQLKIYQQDIPWLAAFFSTWIWVRLWSDHLNPHVTRLAALTENIFHICCTSQHDLWPKVYVLLSLFVIYFV